MKLRNKKTGAIYKIEDIDLGNNEDGIWVGMTKYTSLAELNSAWEDYEEPKEYWCITGRGIPCCLQDMADENDKDHREIGNYFATKEEAEKAVEKLKAWKRLKDAGFEFKGWKVLDHDSPRIYFNVYRKNSDDIVPFLDLLFGGEE